MWQEGENIGGAAADDPGGGGVTMSQASQLEAKFQEQQALIGQLKDKIKDKENKVQTQKKEVQDYSERLARMRPKLGRSSIVSPRPVDSARDSLPQPSTPQGHSVIVTGITEDSSEATTPVLKAPPVTLSDLKTPESGILTIQTPTNLSISPSVKDGVSPAGSTSRSKIQLLRKQLEENRLKFERQQREKSENKAIMDEMKGRINALRDEVEARDKLISSLQDGEERGEPTTQELYHQIMLKDNTILDLSQKVVHLEGVLQEQKEMLEEKNKVIEARTEAVALIAQDRDNKSLKTLNELEDVRCQLSEMQKKFTEHEETWTEEKNDLNKIIAEKGKKISQLEANCRRTESIRFELSTRNAELQEKIVKMQSNIESMRKEFQEERDEYLSKDKIIQELKQNLNKAESFGQKKMKNLEKQLKTIKDKDGKDIGKEILEVQNKVTELEEEKGTLQLKLVDFDDLKVKNEKLLAQRTKLEGKITSLEKELESQLSCITSLENDKIKLVEGLNDRDNKVFDQETTLANMEAEIEEIKQIKVTLELRLCEVEEQRDMAEKIQSDIAFENQSLKDESIVSEIKDKNMTLEEKLKELENILKQKEDMLKDHANRTSSLAEECKRALKEKEEKENANRRLINILAEKESNITSQSIKLDKFDSVKCGLEDRISSMNEELEQKQQQIDKSQHLLKSETQKNHEANILVVNLESKITQLGDDLQAKELEINSIKESKEDLNKIISERNKVINNLEREISTLSTRLQQKEAIVQDYLSRLEEMDERLNMRQDEITRLKRVIQSKEDIISAQNNELDRLNAEYSNSQMALEDLQSKFNEDIKSLNSNLDSKNSRLKDMSSELELKVKEIEDGQLLNVKLKNDYENIQLQYEELNNEKINLESTIHSLQTTGNENTIKINQLNDELIKLNNIIKEKDQYLSNYQIEIESLQVKIENVKEMNTHQQQSLESVSALNETLKNDLEQKDNLISELNQNISNQAYEIDKNRENLQLLQMTLAERNNTVAEVERVLNNTQTQLNMLQSNNTEIETMKEKELGDLQSILLTKDTELKNLTSKVEELIKSSEQLNTELEALKITNNESEIKLTNSASSINELSVMVEQKTNEINNLHIQLEQTNNEIRNLQIEKEQTAGNQQMYQEEANNQLMQLEHANSEINNLNIQLEQANTNINSLQEHLEQTNSKMNGLHIQLEKADGNIESLNQQKDQANSEVISLQQEIAALKSSLDNKDAILNNEQASLQTKLFELELALSQTQSEKINIEKELESIKTEKTAKMEEINELKQQNDNLQTALNKVEEWAEQLQESLDDKDKIISENNSKFEELQSQLVENNFKVEELHNTLMAKENIISTLQVNNEQLTNNLSQNQSVESLRSEYDSNSQALQSEVEQLRNYVQESQTKEQFHKSNIEKLQTDVVQLNTELQKSKLDAESYISELEKIKQEIIKVTEEKIALQYQIDNGNSDSKQIANESIIAANYAITSTEPQLFNTSSVTPEPVLINTSTAEPNSSGALSTSYFSESNSNIFDTILSGNTDAQSGANNSVIVQEIPPEVKTTETSESILEKEDQSSLKEQCDYLSNSVKQLEHKLEEANNTIISLETALATQADVSRHNSSGGWGDVDLGEPETTNLSPQILELEKSLSSKDEMLKLTQERLKETIEKMATSNDEKKLVEQKLETEKEKLNSFREELEKEKMRCVELQQALNEAKYNLQTSTQVEESHVTSQTADSGVSWFSNQNQTENQTTDDQSIQIQQLNTQMSELQYKLSWYEEQWPAWTVHFAQLQESYTQAQTQIAELTAQLEAQRLTVETPKQTEEIQTQPTETENQTEETENQTKDTQNQIEETQQLAEEAQNQAVETLSQVIEAQSSTPDQTDTVQLNHALEKTKRLEEELEQMRQLEIEIPQLQSQIQTLQHECSALQEYKTKSEQEKSRLLETEVLHGELQTSMQETEIKLEGSRSRVQELELMVQSAESEISRLKNQIENLNTVIESNGSREEFVELAKRYEDELKTANDKAIKLQGDVSNYFDMTETLQGQMAAVEQELASTKVVVQQQRQENEVLHSELEVVEGDLSRARTDFEILESEHNTARSEVEAITQSNQILEAEKESLRIEAERLKGQTVNLTSESDHLRGETQRLMEVGTSAESEIARLKTEVERLNQIQFSYSELEKKFEALQSKLDRETVDSKEELDAGSLEVEEVDWGTEGKIEDEHLKQSSPDRQLYDEIITLKEKIIEFEKEKNQLGEELQAARIKHGKTLQKMKIVQAKNEKLQKEMKAKAGGFSDLDQALEDEWKTRIAQVETERDEFKQKLDELQKEKDHSDSQLNVLQNAQERYIDLKESQDTSIHNLTITNKQLAGQVEALEWKISELEQLNEEKSETEALPNDINLLKQQVLVLQQASQNLVIEKQTILSNAESLQIQLQQLSEENAELKKRKTSIEGHTRTEIISTPEELQLQVEELTAEIKASKELLQKAENDCQNYKTTYLELHTEHETVKEENEKLNDGLRHLKYEHLTLKAAYDRLYEEYQSLQDERDNLKNALGILTGERDRLVEEVDSLKNQLEAMQELEEDEVIHNLQQECFNLRHENNSLKDEVTLYTEKIRIVEESAEKDRNAMEKSVELHDYIKHQLVAQTEELKFANITNDNLEQQIKYLQAEIAALRTQATQHTQAQEQMVEQIEKYEAELKDLREQNQQMLLQVNAADASLARISTGSSQTKGEDIVTSQPVASSSPGDDNPELEAAMSSLHLRELRCQQLTLEITKLLEERDALQLKLSASLRQNQELSRELSLSHQLPASPSTSPITLHNKLAELRQLNDSLEQVALENLQGTAASVIRGSRRGSESRDRESQGSLMDWILGKSYFWP